MYKLKVQNEFKELTDQGIIWDKAYYILGKKNNLTPDTVVYYLKPYKGLKNIKCAECKEVFQSEKTNVDYCPKCNTPEKKKERAKRLREEWFNRNPAKRKAIRIKSNSYPRGCYNPSKYAINY